MHPTEVLRRLGGVATWSALRRHCETADLRRLLDAGDVVRDARGRYALPEVNRSLRDAHALTATLSHRSAALHWGWEVARVPALPEVTVRRDRRLLPAQQRRAAFHYADLDNDDVVDGVTSRRRTLHDCLRALDLDEAVAVADSALRHGDVTPEALRLLAGSVAGAGARQARRVAAAADGRAANPFESVLRSLTWDVPHLDVEPQVPVTGPGFYARPDLVDRARGIVLEADSHAFHASRDDLRRDCRRYTGLVALGLVVAKFSWEDVMLHQHYVRAVLTRVAGVVHARSVAEGPARRARRASKDV